MKNRNKMNVLTKVLFAVGLFGTVYMGYGQNNTTPKIVLITLDGYRWQELFTGADPLLVGHEDYVDNATYLKDKFWRTTPEQRRAALMPFFWNEVPKMGQLYGNRHYGNKVNLTNTMWFSYPGYNDLLTGMADDDRINSNAKSNNPNVTLLEHYNKLHKGKAAAFGSWDVFPYIINEERSGVPVNAGFEPAKQNAGPRELFLNRLQQQIPSPWSSVRLDAFTHHYALAFMKRKHPDLIYIAYGETDDFAHNGNYQAYLKSAHNTDALIKELWTFTQTDDYYKDQTLFIITTDHGRGTKPLKTWRSHNSEIQGADQVWLVAFGKGVQPLGELRTEGQVYTNQVAPTILSLLNIHTDTTHKMGKPLGF